MRHAIRDHHELPAQPSAFVNFSFVPDPDKCYGKHINSRSCRTLVWQTGRPSASLCMLLEHKLCCMVRELKFAQKSSRRGRADAGGSAGSKV